MPSAGSAEPLRPGPGQALDGVVALAVVVVRDGVLPLGADEAVAEAGGAVLLVGDGVKEALAQLTAARRAWTAAWPEESGADEPGSGEPGSAEGAARRSEPAVRRTGPGTLAAGLAPLIAPVPVIVLPGSPDGRDLAPRLADRLGRPLLAGAVAVTATGADVVRWGGRALVELTADGPFVATLVPGVRGVEPCDIEPELCELTLAAAEPVADARVVEILAPDPGTADLAEAPRILGAGAGLGGERAVALLGRVGEALGASVGATRVVTDAGWTGYERQIGTTGVVVEPDLYIAFGVSGAAQHIGGLGNPRHVVSVNTDPSCPMTAMAGLGIVADAPAVLAELARLLGISAEAERG